MMRCERDAAIVGIVLHRVPRDEIVMVGAGIVPDEDASRIVVYKIVGHGRVADAAQVNALAAIKTLTRNENLPDARAYRSAVSKRLETTVIAGHMIAGNCDVGHVDRQNTLKVGIGHGESADNNVARVHLDTVRKAQGVNDGIRRVLAKQRQRLIHDHVFRVGAVPDAYRVVGSGRGDGGVDRG